MGAIVRAVCPCGYTSAQFFEGGGMEPGGPVTALTICDHCREVVAVNVRATRYRCRRCRRTVRPPFRSWNEWVRIEGIPALACPRCARSPLPFEMLGIWD